MEELKQERMKELKLEINITKERIRDWILLSVFSSVFISLICFIVPSANNLTIIEAIKYSFLLVGIVFFIACCKIKN